MTTTILLDNPSYNTSKLVNMSAQIIDMLISVNFIYDCFV